MSRRVFRRRPFEQPGRALEKTEFGPKEQARSVKVFLWA